MVDFPVVLVPIFLEVLGMGTFLAAFIVYAFVLPFEVAVTIFLDASAVVTLLVSAVVFPSGIFVSAFDVVFLLDIEIVFVVFTVIIFVELLVVCPF